MASSEPQRTPSSSGQRQQPTTNTTIQPGRGGRRKGSVGNGDRLPLHPTRGGPPATQGPARGGASTQPARGGHQKTGSYSRAVTSPSSAAIPLPSSPSEGEKKLQSLLGDLRNQAASSSPPTATSASPGGTESSMHNPNRHRKSSSGNQGGPFLSPVSVPPPGSGLNPQAGGFQPGGLGSLAEVQNEVLLTPTVPTFDPNVGGGQPSHFAFPPPNQQAQQMPQNPMLQQQFAHLQQLQQMQQTMGMTPQLLEMQNNLFAQMQAQFGAPPPAPSNVTSPPLSGAQPPRFQQGSPSMGLVGSPPLPSQGLASEHAVIQAQLEQLRLQQEALLNRFGNMNIGQPVQQGPPGGHRRVQSQQVAGFNGGPGFSGFGYQQPAMPQQPMAQGLPKGHGRRHSVNVVGRGEQQAGQALPTSASATIIGAPNASMSPTDAHNAPAGIGFGAFQFPGPAGIENQSVGTDLDFGASPPIGTGGVSGAGGFVAGHSRRESRGSMGGSISGWNPGFGMGGGPNDLSLATAQLAQLAAFRASSGHGRVPSFGMSQANQQAGGGGQQQRKSLFAPYLPQNSIQPLVAVGRLVVGTLRVNKRNRSDAYVSSDVLDADIYVSGSKDRNRALEGDVVAVELLDVDEVWSTKKEKEDKKRKKEENSAFDPRVSQAIRRQDKKNDDVEVEGQGLTLFEDEEVNDEQKPKFAGHVVAVVSRTPGQLFSCTLGLLRPSSAATKEKQDAERRERDGVDLRAESNRAIVAPKILWSKPLDKRVPLAAIPVSEAPDGFVDNPEKYANRLFVVAIKRWPITSLHPFGTLIEELGDIGEIEAETSAILKDCNFSSDDFTEPVLKCLPPMPWSIPEREIAARRDFRSFRIFTIDPETAKDLDDAVHVRELDDGTGNLEVGVHIADVTHFVKPNTALDREARKRATTVYLVQRAYPMLPPTLSEELCSLQPGEDRLAFSVVFTLTAQGKVLDTWFGKSVIRSCGKLAYGHAQDVIEGRPLADKVTLYDETPRGEVQKDITLLAGLAKSIRASRFDKGALRIDNIKLTFALGEDGRPSDCRVFERKEANELIEEFMLMANIAVAKKIASAFPDQALLRRHESPIMRRLVGFEARAKRLGFDIDISTAGALMKSFTSLMGQPDSPALVLQLFATKAMVRAKYFCTGALDIGKYEHYALNEPVYTHFTSPIRRYADVTVHRLLEAALMQPGDAKFPIDIDGMTQIAQQCNTKKDAAKLAQEMSQHLYLCALINDLNVRYGPVIRQAKVIHVLDEAFDVLVPDFGIEKRVHIDQMPIENHVHDEHSNELKIYWKPGVNVVKWLAENSGDAHLVQMRQNAERHAKLMEASDSKASDESALFDGGDDGSAPAAAGTPTSAQARLSRDKVKPVFEGVEVLQAGGHHVQTIKQLQTVPVCIDADMTKSPPVIKVVALNPFA